METTERVEESQLNEHDKLLEEKIKSDWYYKTWQSENPKESMINKIGIWSYKIFGTLCMVLFLFAGFKYIDLDKTLRNTDPLLLLATYNNTIETIYFLIAGGAFCLAANMIINSFITQWTGVKLVQWHDKLKIDKIKIAVGIVSVGKSHNLYNNAIGYLYCRAKAKKPAFCSPRKDISVGTWKSTILVCIFSFCFAVAIAVGVCIFVKANAKETLKNAISGVQPPISASFGIGTMTIIFIIGLALLIAVLLIIPKILNNIKSAFVKEQIKNGVFTPDKK